MAENILFCDISDKQTLYMDVIITLLLRQRFSCWTHYFHETETYSSDLGLESCNACNT